jgi:hypothetical protein
VYFPAARRTGLSFRAADSVAHRKAVQRFAAASRGTIVLNRLQLIGLPFTKPIPKLGKFNFCCALDEARSQRLINPELDDDKEPVRLIEAERGIQGQV